MIPDEAVEAEPLIFRQAPHYIITTGGAGLHVRTEDPARLIDIMTGKADGLVIPDEAVEAAAQALWTPSNEGDTWESEYEPYKEHTRAEAKRALEVAAPHLLAHEREQTRLAHLDAMVNRETKRAELEAAWNDGHLMGWNEATANTLPERDSLWRNPYRKPDDA